MGFEWGSQVGSFLLLSQLRVDLERAWRGVRMGGGIGESGGGGS